MNAKSFGYSTFKLFYSQLIERLRESFTNKPNSFSDTDDITDFGYLGAITKTSDRLNVGIFELQKSLMDFERIISSDFKITRSLILSNGVKTAYPHKAIEFEEIDAILNDAIVSVINLRKNLKFLEINFEKEGAEKLFFMFYTGVSKLQLQHSYNDLIQSELEIFLRNWQKDVQQLALNVPVIPQVHIEEATDEDRKHDNY